MSSTLSNAIVQIFNQHEPIILEDWMVEQLASLSARRDALPEPELRTQSKAFLALFIHACHNGEFVDMASPCWWPVLEFLADMASQRAQLGFSSSEAVAFIFSFRQPVFARVREALGADVGASLDQLWVMNVLLDKLALYTMEVFFKSREAVIKHQQLSLLAISTPVLGLWDDILAVSLLGALDAARVELVIQNLLDTFAATGSRVAIVDLTGAPTADRFVGQYLLKMAVAVRLMGAQCIFCGISPAIAQTMAELDVPLGAFEARATFSDALAAAFGQSGHQVVALATQH